MPRWFERLPAELGFHVQIRDPQTGHVRGGSVFEVQIVASH